MAEFCLDCWNKINEANDSKRKYIISKDLDLCEECGEWKNVIIAERRGYYWRKLQWYALYFLSKCRKSKG